MSRSPYTSGNQKAAGRRRETRLRKGEREEKGCTAGYPFEIGEGSPGWTTGTHVGGNIDD